MRTDVDLLESWREGDIGAGDQLLQKHFASVHRFFRTKIGDDVDDLVQQTFLGCVQNRDRVKDGAFRPYLFGIARKRLYDRLRGTKHEIDMDTECVADCATSPSQKVARNQEEQLLLLAMREISINAQIVLEMTYWEGMSGQEVAAVLGVSEHTVRSRLSRARDLLRERLAKSASSKALAESSYKALETI